MQPLLFNASEYESLENILANRLDNQFIVGISHSRFDKSLDILNYADKLESTKPKEALIIENVDNKINENLLFSLWNLVMQDNKYFLITSIKPINFYKFKLPDLKSRVMSCFNVGIKLPDDDLISVILAKNFSDKQVKIEKKHIDYIIKRIDRSYEKISQFIVLLDKYSLKKGRPFSFKLIKEVLKMI